MRPVKYSVIHESTYTSKNIGKYKREKTKYGWCMMGFYFCTIYVHKTINVKQVNFEYNRCNEQKPKVWLQLNFDLLLLSLVNQKTWNHRRRKVNFLKYLLDNRIQINSWSIKWILKADWWINTVETTERTKLNKNTEKSSDIIASTGSKQELCHQKQAAETNKQGFSDFKMKVYRCELTWVKQIHEFIQVIRPHD